MTDYRPPRLTIEITQEQADFLRNILPYGLKKELFGILIDSLMEAIQEHGVKVLALVIERKVSLATLMGISNGSDQSA